jgi:hypothetical protein
MRNTPVSRSAARGMEFRAFAKRGIADRSLEWYHMI